MVESGDPVESGSEVFRFEEVILRLGVGLCRVNPSL